MMDKTNTHYIVHASYDDDDILIDAVKASRNAGYEIAEVYTPFAVHGLDKAMGLKPTRLSIATFLFGLTGFLIALTMTNYMMIVDWPQNFGGKPNMTYVDNAPAFVPILFELVIFFASHLMVITFYLKSRLWPWKVSENPHPKTTDDMFVIELEVYNDTDKTVDFLKSTGAFEVKITAQADSYQGNMPKSKLK